MTGVQTCALSDLDVLVAAKNDFKANEAALSAACPAGYRTQAARQIIAKRDEAMMYGSLGLAECKPERERVAKCVGGNVARDCVKLDQTRRTGLWHMYRITNTCNRSFQVKVFSCNEAWAGGCEVASRRIAACSVSGSDDGNQSFRQDAQLRW